MSRFELDLAFARGDLELTWQLASDCAWLGLFGASGRGKTTALELLLGWLRPDRGSARLDGAPVGVGSIGYAPQDLLLLPHWTVAQNLDAAREAAPEPLPEALEAALLLALELEPLLARQASALSGGEGRRVTLARAVLAAARTGLLVLDEPLASLDRGRRQLVLGFLLDLADWRRTSGGGPAVVVSHSAIDLMVLCDEVQVLETVVTADGTRRSRFLPPGVPAEVLAEEGGYENLLVGKVERVFGDAASFALPGGAEITIPGRDLEAGDRVVLGLRGDDVLVATEDPGAVSARNVLEGRVATATARGAYVALGIDLAGVSRGSGDGTARLVIETHVTEGALRDLDLELGRRVLLLFKTRSIAILARR